MPRPSSNSEVHGEIGPDWKTVIAYEHAIRREAVHLIIYEGADFATAMKKARMDEELRSREFMGPALVSVVDKNTAGRLSGSVIPPSGKGGTASAVPAAAAGARAASMAGPASEPSRRQKRKAAEVAKGASKGKTAWHRVTADGKPICFRYNSAQGCKDQKCAREHVCQRCLLRHSAAAETCEAGR